ncbi:uncharacterized protein Z520_05286 [Fonsecaea multimorphosa CBS 102226]|uniref:Sec20 C-terminal domain-containing protein n=1 Tax=Fonsecaea multimorphosa CBS 102226 TaxID=1442371 RepID=A0A0D2HAC5_9EURO|nr:uncharacterized protein Z520_05286 [Fonsecaea multimorphosa CBS 102226]KIX98825.1 hypothetical protein Z520_05286 [Fonsecaea multimorphosa CBS 102226]OAL25105.1 hypothetical protein AYO22_04982 [Fonsecaea multimorphosa]
MSLSLSQRLQALADSYKEILSQIQELRRFSASSYPSGNPDERRLELATEIHDNLKEQEDRLEILRQEFEDDAIPNHRRDLSSRESERERNADLLARLSEDLKSARANFRKAQLQAKRTADAEKRKEREQLFADRKQDGGKQQARGRATHEKLTQDELALRAAEDVTIALRRVHNQLEGELSVSQFAQQTLEESQQALDSLSYSYAGTTDLLKASRGFVGQLVRSNKSDTWFLKSSFYILAATICWLFYRRILYGPMMLFIWWPLRIMWWVTLKSFGVVGLGGRSEVVTSPAPSVPSLTVSMPGMNARGMPTHKSNVYFKSMELPAKGGGARGPPPEIPQQQTSPEEAADSMIERIGRMMEDQGTNVDDITDEERRAQQDQPRNTKKRMMEVDVEQARDEL